jgi:nicotinamidase-related amidase
VLPLPPHFDPDRVGELRRVDYARVALEAERLAAEHGVPPADDDATRICVLLVDVQNTFCLPGFELFVAGRSGSGAVDDTRRLCEFLYRNLGSITQVVPTLDTHQAMQIFHAVFLVDREGRHPDPYTIVTAAEVERGEWRVNPAVAKSLGFDAGYLQRHLLHYVHALEAGTKYALTIWPYHALLGSVGHALVPAVEEAIFFHTVARLSQPDFEVKGQNPLTEHYSALGPEVTAGPDGRPIAGKTGGLVEHLLDAPGAGGRRLAERVYLLEDCTSAVVVPGVIDYTAEADAAFARFAEAGMHVVRSTTPMDAWPGLTATAVT